jgi:hypothetical protein
VVLHRLNSAVTLIQRTTTEAPRRTYVLHRTGRTQEDDQLLREGHERIQQEGKVGSTRRGMIRTMHQLVNPEALHLLRRQRSKRVAKKGDD